jgi:hypothetical protein
MTASTFGGCPNKKTLLDKQLRRLCTVKNACMTSAIPGLELVPQSRVYLNLKWNLGPAYSKPPARQVC